MSNKLIMIGTPSGDMVHADYAFSLSMLCMTTLSAGIPVGVSNVKSTLVDVGRNMLVEQALQNNASHILFVDSDMAFKPDLLLNLLEHGVGIVGTTYCSRRTPFILLHHNDDEKDVRSLKEDIGIYPVKGIPFGFVLINTAVFKKLSPPWFVCDVRVGQGEDLYFCDRALKVGGFQTFLDVDASRKIRHCGMHYYSLDDAKPADLQGNYL